MPDAIEPGLKIVERPHAAVYVCAEVEPLDRRIRKTPVWAVENETVVHHVGDKSKPGAGRNRGCRLAEACPEENRLPRVRIAGPLIEDKHAEKVRQVHHFFE